MAKLNIFILWVAIIHALNEITNVVTTTFAQNTTQCGNLTCANEARCRDDGHGGYHCSCHIGYIGTTCLDDFDECVRGSPCMHRGRCHNSVGSFRCECLEGWSGVTHCEIKDNSTTVHKCMPGWIGDLCQDQCLNDSMCQPTEVCKRRGRGLHCLCAPGWYGVNCTTDINECAQTPCPRNATCLNTPGSYKCRCLSGWKGDKCEKDVDECLVNPCHHSSTCTNEQGYYNCTCTVGWKGDNCTEDIDECTSTPCFNSGTCINTNGSYTCKCDSGWQGHNCSEDINECEKNPCNVTSSCENTPGSFSCAKQLSPNVQHFHFEDAVRANCTSYGWNISFDVTILQSLYTGITPKDIYLGPAKCKGTPHDNELWFQQSFNSCLTSEKEVDGTKVFQNVLFYATLDSVDPTIVRQHFWTYNVACYVANGETASLHLHHEVESHSTNITGHRDIALTFFKDQNFLHRVSGNPLRVIVGDKIYVKVSTAIPDWNTKMRLHTCYTRSSDNTLAEHTLIKDGCEVDSSTHIISQSTHETKFVFRDFEYVTFNEGLDIYCNATFCATGDYSPACTQACRQSPPIVG